MAGGTVPDTALAQVALGVGPVYLLIGFWLGVWVMGRRGD